MVRFTCWASLSYGCFDTKTGAKCLDFQFNFFIFYSWLSLGFFYVLLCFVTGHRGRIDGGSGG